MRFATPTLLILSLLWLTACGSPGSDSDGDGLTCGAGTRQEGDQCVGTGNGGGGRPDVLPALTGDFGADAYAFVRYSYVMTLLSDGERVAIRIVFDDITAPVMQIEGPVTGATTFALDIAGVDVNGDLIFGEGEVFESSGAGSLVEAENYDGRIVQVLSIENLVIGGEEFGFIDGILDSTYPLSGTE